MLQRAASNAYSWWWASHIRTKQSKWLEQNLLDMEEKVQTVLKLIEEDGDSFAKRAEMYYKKRPELINFVEESYRAYRALAERYDHISTELQHANNTIASVFPEQVQLAMDEEDQDASAGVPKKVSEALKSNIPKVPKGPLKELKSIITTATATKKLLPKRTTKAGTAAMVPKSGLKKSEALEEIDRLQKQILALQTEKEFVKSSYENGVAKFWEIENRIKEVQERVSSLQDEFGEGMVIEDDEARNLMAEAAIKSCQERLVQLQEKQERSTEEAMVESRRIKDTRDKLESLKGDFQYNQTNEENPVMRDESKKAVKGIYNLDEEVVSEKKERQELEMLREKIKEQFEARSNTSLTVMEMVEKIDELVNKVISLETAVSSQAALVKRLKSETDELQAQIRNLESEKASLIDGKNDIRSQLKEMEAKLDGIQVLNQSFKKQNNNVQTHFSEAHCNLDRLLDKLQSVKPEEELNITGSSETELASVREANLQKHFAAQEDIVNPFEDFPSKENTLEEYEKIPDVKPYEEIKDTSSLQKERESPTEERLSKETKEQEDRIKTGDDSTKATSILNTSDCDQQKEVSHSQADQKLLVIDDKQTPLNSINAEPKEQSEEEGEPDWQKLFMSGIEDKQKILLTEYTSTLRNYKDTKKKLSEVEKTSRDNLFEISLQLKELKSANAKKDDEIRTLRLKLGLLEETLNIENKDKDVEISEDTKTIPPAEEVGEGRENIKSILTDQTPTMSATEEKFRMSIDELLEQNLDFWLRFSSSYHQIQKFDTEVQDLKSEISKLEEKRKNQGSTSNNLQNLFKSDARPLYKHLREIQSELAVWCEKSALLKEELQSRFSSLCDIQEEIIMALKISAEDDDIKFTSYQAAKFQGEVLNMKQENNKVADELQAGLDHVTIMQIDVERTLVRLNEEFSLAGSKKRNEPHLSQTASRSHVPLRLFIFGMRQKKQRPSIFSFMTPAMHRKYHGLRAGPPF